MSYLYLGCFYLYIYIDSDHSIVDWSLNHDIWFLLILQRDLAAILNQYLIHLFHSALRKEEFNGVDLILGRCGFVKDIELISCVSIVILIRKHNQQSVIFSFSDI